MEPPLGLFGKGNEIAARRPDRRAITPLAKGNPPRLPAAGGHHIKLLTARAVALKHDLAAIGAKAGGRFNRRGAGQTFRLSAAHAHGVDVCIAALTDGIDHRLPVRCKAGRKTHGALLAFQHPALHRSDIQHVDAREPGFIAGVKDAVAIGGKARGKHNRLRAGQILHVGPVIVHDGKTLAPLGLGAGFRHKHHTAVKIATLAGDPAINRIGHLVCDAPPAISGANKLQPVAQFRARKHVIKAEFHYNLIALDADRTGDQSLRIDRLPVSILHRCRKIVDLADE
mmetsp:Transcript_28668/g.54116  ORF Transcript_28668/g.54116 Transcript_28668/m.54116 type:complete len:284 (-) Transcript_28668:314-1165(-)